MRHMARIIDPWGSELVEDYNKLIKDFGLEVFNPKLFPEPNRIMRRGVVFAGRDLRKIATAIRQKKPYYVLSGIMPTAQKVHLGNKMVVENIRYFQDHGGKAYILVADLESQAVRDLSLDEAKKRALGFQIPAYVALGLNPKKTVFYLQSENKQVVHLAYKFAKKVTLNEFKALYGSAEPGRIMGALTQVGDILYPQLNKKMPGIIPVGIDQDPHIRLTRDIVNRTKKMGFVPPSSMYHKYTPSLDGSLKMSKSRPEGCIELPDDPKKVCKKLMRAKTGGRDTEEQQKKLGGQPEKCMIFELYKQHLIEDDKELQRIYDECKAGTLLCGEDKKRACKLMTKFMNDFMKKVKKAKKQVKEIEFVEFS